MTYKEDIYYRRFVKELAKKYNLDVMDVKRAIKYPFKYAKDMMRHPTDTFDIKLLNFGTFELMKGYRLHKQENRRELRKKLREESRANKELYRTDPEAYIKKIKEFERTLDLQYDTKTEKTCV